MQGSKREAPDLKILSACFFQSPGIPTSFKNENVQELDPAVAASSVARVMQGGLALMSEQPSVPGLPPAAALDVRTHNSMGLPKTAAQRETPLHYCAERSLLLDPSRSKLTSLLQGCIFKAQPLLVVSKGPSMRQSDEREIKAQSPLAAGRRPRSIFFDESGGKAQAPLGPDRKPRSIFFDESGGKTQSPLAAGRGPWVRLFNESEMKVELPGVLSRSSSNPRSDRGRFGSPASPAATPTATTAPPYSSGGPEEGMKSPECLWSMSDEQTAQHYKMYVGGRAEKQSSSGGKRFCSDFVSRWIEPNSPGLVDTLGAGVEGVGAGDGAGEVAVVSVPWRESRFVSDRGVPAFPCLIASDRTANSPPPGEDAKAGRRDLERSWTKPRVQSDHLRMYLASRESELRPSSSPTAPSPPVGRYGKVCSPRASPRNVLVAGGVEAAAEGNCFPRGDAFDGLGPWGG
eukprot:gene10678-12368_t